MLRTKGKYSADYLIDFLFHTKRTASKKTTRFFILVLYTLLLRDKTGLWSAPKAQIIKLPLSYNDINLLMHL